MSELWPTDVRRRSTQVVVLATVAVLVAMVLQLLVGTSSIGSRMYRVEAVYRPPFVPAISPVLAAEEGLGPTKATASPNPDPTIETILLYQSGVSLYRGGVFVRSVSLQQSHLGRTPRDLARLIDDPAWVSTRGSVVTLHAGLVTLDATKFVVATPVTSELVLDGRPGVFLAATDGSLVVDHARITSTTPTAGTPRHPSYRPFVLATAGVSFVAEGARFDHLGWDWLDSYGVTLVDSVSGEIHNSTFDHNFIGLYTQHVRNYVVRDSTFTNNALYGIDPHSSSSYLTIQGNTASHNAAHGIILSQSVTHSTIVGNTSVDNGENGIMLDAASNDDVVAHNTVRGNHGDGVVVAGSTGATISANRITANRIGVSVYGRGAARATANVLRGNLLPSGGITLDASNAVDGRHDIVRLPPPAWHGVADAIAWSIAAALYLTTYLLRRRERTRFAGYHLNPPQVAGA